MGKPAKDQDKQQPESSSGSFLGGLEQLIGGMEARASRIKSLKRRSVKELANLPASGYQHLQEYAWTRSMLTWGNLEVLALLFMAILIWFAFYKAYTRPETIIMLPPTVKERINEFYGMGTVSRDSIDKFLKNTLQELHLLTPEGKPFLPLLLGSVSPEIYRRAVEDFQKNATFITKNSVVQTLIITRIQRHYLDKEKGQIFAYVRGYYVITRLLPNPETDSVEYKRAVVPYRAKVILEQVPATDLNSSGFYLVSEEFRVGEIAKEWDKEGEK